VARQDLVRQAHALAAEDQHRAFWIARRAEVARGARREEEGRAQLGQGFLQRRPARPEVQMRHHPRPVVEARAAHRAIVERETDRPDQVQLGADGQAGPTGVAGVPGDLGRDQHDVQSRRRR